MARPTNRQLELLKFIHDTIEEKGVSPSYEEMATGLGLVSKSGVYQYTNLLIERGLVVRMKGRDRGLDLTREGLMIVRKEATRFRVVDLRAGGGTFGASIIDTESKKLSAPTVAMCEDFAWAERIATALNRSSGLIED